MRARAWKYVLISGRSTEAAPCPLLAPLRSPLVGNTLLKVASQIHESFPLEGAKYGKIGLPKVFFLESYAIAGKTITKDNWSPIRKGFSIPSLPQTPQDCIRSWSLSSRSCCDYAGLLPSPGNVHGAELDEAFWGEIKAVKRVGAWSTRWSPGFIRWVSVSL